MTTQLLARPPTRGHGTVSRRALAVGLSMTYRQLDHACRTVHALSEMLPLVGQGGAYRLSRQQIIDVRRMLLVVDDLIGAGIDRRDVLDAVARAATVYEPGTELVVWRAHDRVHVAEYDPADERLAVTLIVRLPNDLELPWLDA